jgi:hypothetical protein
MASHGRRLTATPLGHRATLAALARNQLAQVETAAADFCNFPIGSNQPERGIQ